MKLVFKTPAKINLGLRILGKRGDGYHELETLLQMIGLYDELEMEPTNSDIEFECDTPGIPTDESNLVLQAARLLRNRYPERTRAGVRIRLRKTIPSGAGLGGGSGNAAGALMGLNIFWNLELTRPQLLQLAPQLGADVAFFLFSSCALGRGRGELLESVQPAKKFYVILIFPGFSVATAWVYGNLNLKLTNQQNNISILPNILSRSDIPRLGSSLQNDLEDVVIQRFPEIQTLKDRLQSAGAQGALMSGSGSAVFGLFEKFDPAKKAFAGLEKGSGQKFFLTETVSGFSEFLPEEIINYPRNLDPS
ncbi:MAG: 4-(cytidine 5'-diphospho)-2-C-methyl-D-erythritol kinase [Nitrospinota bacterium]|nr:4-(cytidine 5'-diphospho)-2-C-methyl-D-erythritol kinase [Nitrospinota bacterium]